MRDPLAFDAALVMFGVILTVVSGTALYANGGHPDMGAIAAGVAVTVTAALLAQQFGARLRAINSRLAELDRTLCGRAVLVLLVVVAVLTRLLVLPVLPEAVFHGLTAAAATVAGVGLSRALFRAIRSSVPAD